MRSSLFAVPLLWWCPLLAQKLDKPCDRILTTLTPQRYMHLEDRVVHRLEIRDCGPVLQLVGWEDRAQTANLVVDTDRTTVVSIVMRGDIVVLEMAGASSNVIFVVAFSSGVPQLVFRRGYKAYATITTTMQEVIIQIPNIAGKNIWRFPTNIN